MKSGKIYLRPASAYLRSSYPASTLNANSSTVWRNDLERQAWRSLPLIGNLVDAQGKAQSAALHELDKQSWQNINRVRVAGAGDANYVIAKDDIGNWYVKSYASNPSNIVKTASNLALMSMGTTGLNALSGGKGLIATNSPFNGEFELAATNYLTQTSNSWFNLTNQLLGTGFIDKLIRAWSSAGLTDLAGLTNIAIPKASDYTTVVTNGAANIAKANGSAQAFDAAILDLLTAVKRYHGDVRPNLTANPTTSTAQAQQTFSTYVRGFLDGVVAERAQALDRFDVAIELIEGASSK